MRLVGWLALALVAGGCASVEVAPRRYAHARIAADFDSYHLRRVGLPPFRGAQVDPGRALTLQRTFAFELARTAPFEIVELTNADIAEIESSDPLRRGVYDPHELLGLARRFRLDGVFVGTVTEMQLYVPQALAVELELVAAETGQAIWASRVALDASEPALRATLERWHAPGAMDEPADAQLAWLSPERLARFAACALAESL